MRRIAIASLLLAAACKKGPDPEIARLNGVVESLRKEMADDRAKAAAEKAAKDREIEGLRAQVAEATKQAGLADSLKARLEELTSASAAQLRDVQASLEAKAKEAATALAKVADLEKLKAGVDASLKETKSLLDKRSKDLDALKAELATLKSLLGK